MKSKIKLMSIFVGLVMVTSAAQSAEPNGCGTGWSTFVVPNRIGVLNCELKSSCDLHDGCYSLCDNSTTGQCVYRRCREGGDLFGQDICETDSSYVYSLTEAAKRRATCDVALGDAIRDKNKGKWGCEAVGVVYRFAVKTWGDGAFAGFGTLRQPAAWRQSQKEYNKAIFDFLSQASESDFKKFVEAADSQQPLVNFCGRLQYTATGGLTNLSKADSDACPLSPR